MLSFTIEELETYFKLQARAEEYMNLLLRHKRIAQTNEQKEE